MSEQALFLPRVLMNRAPEAWAEVMGGSSDPNLNGRVLFYPFMGGSLVAVSVTGLPGNGFHGFHVHENGSCAAGADGGQFGAAGGHYNPGNVPHPDHAGDLPPLLAGNGFAYSIFYTDRFTPDDVVGRSVIIHADPDDFTTQPAGNSGARIACGVIMAL